MAYMGKYVKILNLKLACYCGQRLDQKNIQREC